MMRRKKDKVNSIGFKCGKEIDSAGKENEIVVNLRPLSLTI
jgi:hypothetical protein